MLRYNKKVKQIGGVKMKIQKGLVKYKERSDIICTYGITDDGKQYYFSYASCERGTRKRHGTRKGNRKGTKGAGLSHMHTSVPWAAVRIHV